MTNHLKPSFDGEFIMLSDGSFVFFSVNGGQAEIKPPFDSLNINIPLNLNVNVPVKQLVKSAAVFGITVVSLAFIPLHTLTKSKDSIIFQQPQIVYVGNTELSTKTGNGAPIYNHSANSSISDLSSINKVDLHRIYSSDDSIYSSDEKTSLNLVNSKNNKSNTFKKKNKDSLVKSIGKNPEKSNSPKGFLKYVKIIGVGSMELSTLVSNQPLAGQALNQPIPNVGPDVVQPNEQRLAEEIAVLTDVNQQYSEKLLYKTREGANGIIRDLTVLDETLCNHGLDCKNEADRVVQTTSRALQQIQQGPSNLRLKNTRNKAITLAKTVEDAWNAGDGICTQTANNIRLILPHAEALPGLLERTAEVIYPLRGLLNSRVNHVLNPTITHKHEHFGEAVRSLVIPDVVQPFNENYNPLDRLQVIYNLFQPHDFLNIENPVIRYHNGILPQKIVLGVIDGQNDNQAARFAERINQLPGDVVHGSIQQALVLNGINEIVPGAQPQSITLELPINPLENVAQVEQFPVRVWSDTSHIRVSPGDLENIKPVAAVIMDKVDIQHANPPIALDNNVNNLSLKGNLLIATRLKVDTEIPHFSGLVQADLFNLNHSNAPLKDRLFVGGSVDLLGAVGFNNYQPWLIELSAQKSVLSPGYRISLNVGLELGF